MQECSSKTLMARFAACLEGKNPDSPLTKHLQQHPWPVRADAMGEHPMHSPCAASGCQQQSAKALPCTACLVLVQPSRY